MKTMPKEGMRVKVKSVEQKGKIFYIDHASLYLPHFLPIQVELDQPYDEHGQRMYRTDIKDLVRLKKKTTGIEEKPKKKKVKKRVKKDDDLFDFTDQ